MLRGSLLVHLALSMLMLVPASARCRSDVLGRAAALAVDEALPAAMLPSQSEALPYLQTATLDELFAVWVLVDHEFGDFVGPVAVTFLVAITPTMPTDEAVDGILDLMQLLSRTVFVR